MRNEDFTAKFAKNKKGSLVQVRPHLREFSCLPDLRTAEGRSQNAEVHRHRGLRFSFRILTPTLWVLFEQIWLRLRI
jgi:hypothetical protein